MRASAFLAYILSTLFPALALAGPPYVTDDPEPTDYKHFEIYAFTDGANTRDGTGGTAGIDFNYGGAPDLQLTMVLPLEYDDTAPSPPVAGLGNVELAAKYRFLHQEDFGWDVAVFPRVFLPSASPLVGDRHGSFLVPVWAEKDFGAWSTFGGGGCALNNGGGSQDYCLMGWALTRAFSTALHVGAEIYHQTADTRGGYATTGVGIGATYDLTENYHMMASFGPGIQNAAETNRYSWYTAILFTF